MKGKIGLEEHFALPDTAVNPRGTYAESTWAELKARLLELHGERLALMDKHGIEMMVVSLNAPAVQAIPDPKKAVEVARRANDTLAEQIAKRPDRFQGLAALAMQDPDAAIKELERCVKELGFKGALVNGFSQVNDPDNAVYYDLPQFRPFWAAVEKLDVPFYLHPRSPLPRDARLYAGHPWLMGAAWAFGNETAVHALRLMGSGLFDEHPRARDCPWPPGRGDSVWPLADRQLQCRRAEDGRQPGQEEDCRVRPLQFLRDDVGQLQHPVADPCDPPDRRRPRHVLGRLAV
jgi:predicted TIM-barrel fold metal-dependent hydrolase